MRSPAHRWRWTACALIALASATPAQSQFAPSDNQLVVVADAGGVSALPYYRALNLLPSSSYAASSLPSPKMPHSATEEAAFLPVHTSHLSPGDVTPQVLQAPGLTPFFLLGDDERSRRWLLLRLTSLRQIGAVGFIVQVENPTALRQLRALAPGIDLVPASADDVASRLHLAHYPALVTATGIEQ